jgi:hypothetical protein
MLTIAEIQARYPNPVSVKDSDPGGCLYCVGSATLKAHGLPAVDAFPDEDALTKGFLALNPALQTHEAWVYDQACALIDANDSKRFTKAWEIAETLLTSQ